jgi:hypothetical protein
MLVVIASVLCSCRGSLAPLDYVRWVEDEAHGLHLEKEVGDIKFSLQYQPVEYLTAMQEKTNSLEKGTLDSNLNSKKNTLCFLFRFESTGPQKDVLKMNLDSKQEYFDRILYMTDEMQNDFQLVSGKDTLLCKLYHYERTYNLSPRQSFLTVFERKAQAKIQDDLIFIYQDKILGTGTIRMRIKAEDIKKIPTIKTI